MKNFLIFLVTLTTVFIAKSDNLIESFNEISDNYVNDIHDVQIIRSINGGTVIIPFFDESCPEQIKAPFSFACKIVEEYLPPCLPLKVQVSCGRVNGSSANAISKVMARSKENFGNSQYYTNAQMSVIKGVILSELCYNSTVTYLDSVPDIEFLTKDPDIEITYNSLKLDNISFSLDANPGSNYDFVSIAVRDLLIGLGLSSSYRYNPITKELLDPSHELTPFEIFINDMLGNYGNSSDRLAQATKGELLLYNRKNKSLKLYAPNPWKNGLSLNYFIPQEDCCVSNILSYDFCKGMVTRTLSDDYSQFIFHDLLGWKASYVSGTSSNSLAVAGSTSLLMPYNGSISFADNTYGIKTFISPESQHKNIRAFNYIENEDLRNYINSFHPFLYSDDYVPSEGTSISVLKKDGSWDLVKCLPVCVEGISIAMSDLDFHSDESQYARTIDGYLRARVTTKQSGYGTGIVYDSKFFVIDYLPQKVNLSYAFINAVQTRASSSGNTVRIYFSNTEGLSRIVLEKSRPGIRLPSKIDVLDFKKGYYETTVDKTTTFTAVGYNNNGTSRGVPITITPQPNTLSLDFNLIGNCISFKSDKQLDKEYSYKINQLEVYQSDLKQIGSTKGTVDISPLADGVYVLTVIDKDSGMSDSFKFKK